MSEKVVMVVHAPKQKLTDINVLCTYAVISHKQYVAYKADLFVSLKEGGLLSKFLVNLSISTLRTYPNFISLRPICT